MSAGSNNTVCCPVLNDPPLSPPAQIFLLRQMLEGARSRAGAPSLPRLQAVPEVGARLLALPHSLQMKTESIYSPACHPAASGRGITLATLNRRASLRTRRWSAGDSHTLSHTHTSSLTTFLLHACVFLSGLSPQVFSNLNGTIRGALLKGLHVSCCLWPPFTPAKSPRCDLGFILLLSKCRLRGGPVSQRGVGATAGSVCERIQVCRIVRA